MEKRDLTCLPSCAKQVSRIAHGIWHVTSAEGLCCFCHPLLAPRKFHDFLHGGLKTGLIVGVKGLDCVIVAYSEQILHVDFTCDIMTVENVPVIHFKHYIFYIKLKLGRFFSFLL